MRIRKLRNLFFKHPSVSYACEQHYPFGYLGLIENVHASHYVGRNGRVKRLNAGTQCSNKVKTAQRDCEGVGIQWTQDSAGTMARGA